MIGLTFLSNFISFLFLPLHWILSTLVTLLISLVPVESICISFLQQNLREGKLVLDLGKGRILSFGSGSGPSATIQVVRLRQFWESVCFGFDVGFAESYIVGDWTTPSLHDVMLVLANNRFKNSSSWSMLRTSLNYLSHLQKANSISRARQNISAHYDLSNEFFQLILDPTMSYSSAIFDGDVSLEDAQLFKIDLLLERAKLKEGDHLLEIGSGWGSLAVRAAKKFKCRVTSITISRQQLLLAQKRAESEGVTDLVEFKFLDYRDLPSLGMTFDAVISCEMIEAVGLEYYPIYFKVIDQVLKPQGVVVLQAITIPDRRFPAYSKSCDFIQKYIFPGGICPSLTMLQNAMTTHSQLFINNLTNYSQSYHKTLEMWNKNMFQNQEAIAKLNPKFDEKFFKTWEYYFQYCSVGFQTRSLNLLHLTLTREGKSRVKDL